MTRKPAPEECAFWASPDRSELVRYLEYRRRDRAAAQSRALGLLDILAALSCVVTVVAVLVVGLSAANTPQETAIVVPVALWVVRSAVALFLAQLLARAVIRALP